MYGCRRRSWTRRRRLDWSNSDRILGLIDRICDEHSRHGVLLPAELGEMNPPEIFEAGRRMNNFHRVRLAALPSSVVHDCGARLNGMRKDFGVRNGLAVVRHDPKIHGSETVLRTHQIEFLVPCEIAEMQHAELSKRHMASDRLRILRFVHLLSLKRGAIRIRLPRPGHRPNNVLAR